MNIKILFFLLLVLSMGSCIGDDFIEDFVEPEIRIIDAVDTIAVGDTYQMRAQFFNEVGKKEEVVINWSSSDESVAIISDEGVLWARSKGEIDIVVSTEYEGNTISASKRVIADEETVEVSSSRSGTLKTTSTYVLEGGFELSTDSGKLVLSLDENYRTTDVLPGLYVYLTNNPNSINDAFLISKVDIFEGAHSYDIEGDHNVDDYSHVLYYCKPFKVKVGDGAFEN